MGAIMAPPKNARLTAYSTGIGSGIMVALLCALIAWQSHRDTISHTEADLVSLATFLAADVAREEAAAIQSLKSLQGQAQPTQRSQDAVNESRSPWLYGPHAPDIVDLGIVGTGVEKYGTTGACLTAEVAVLDDRAPTAVPKVVATKCAAGKGVVYFATPLPHGANSPPRIAFVGLKAAPLNRSSLSYGLMPKSVVSVFTDRMQPVSEWTGTAATMLEAEDAAAVLRALQTSGASARAVSRFGPGQDDGIAAFARNPGSSLIVGAYLSPRVYLNDWRRNTAALLTVMVLSFVAAGAFLVLRQSALDEHGETLRILKALMQEKREAEEANLAKSEYLAIMSHEIRTSMSGVLNMAEFMLRSKVYKEQHSGVRVLYDAGQNLVQIINKVLDFSKIESGTLELSLMPFEPGELLAKVGELFSQEAKNKGLTLEVVKPDSACWVTGDDLRIRQILANFVGNALKFTSAGGVSLSLSVTASTNSDAQSILHFAVRDSGPGIAEDRLNSLFLPFHQGDSLVARRFGGTGLGLSICKRLSDLMGGRVWVDSNPGLGSTFCFDVECERAGPVGQAPPLPDLSMPPSPLKKPASILLAEDNLSNQRIAKMYLEREGYKVSCADDGAQAVSLFKGETFDLILMDGSMPVMDGYLAAEAIRKLETAEGRPRVPIIATTAHTGEANELKCRDAGMDDFVPKPYRFADLKKKINRWLPDDKPSVT